VGALLTALDAIPGLGGVPTLDDLLDMLGLTATQTTFNSTYNWPLLGLGPLLGLSGSTTISNTFAQLPSLTGSALIGEIVGGLTLAGQPLPAPLAEALTGSLSPLSAISTPSVTAWVPLGQGNYGLPLGGQIGWLATMPTLAIGPIPPLSTTDTVIAIPIAAAGAVLPLGLASFGTVATPGVVFPTATGVSTLGGTSLTSLAVPLVGLSLTNLNILSATYVGTNGINYNSGTSVLTLITPAGALPLIYSLGTINIGTTGFGFTLPSLFTIGLLPSFQIGTAPTQQSPDGLIPASVLNLGLGIPTQTTDVVTLLGLPNPGDAVEAVVNPAFNTLVAPVGLLITNGLNTAVGPLANGLASLTEQLTALLAQLTGGGAQAFTPTATTLAAPAPQDVPADDTAPQSALIPSLPQGVAQNAADNDVQSGPADPAPKTGPRLNVITQTGNPATGVIRDGIDAARTSGTIARNQLTTTVKNLTDRVTDTVTNVVGRGGDDSTNSTTSSTSTGTS
jgi:hypothetical protein